MQEIRNHPMWALVSPTGIPQIKTLERSFVQCQDLIKEKYDIPGHCVISVLYAMGYQIKRVEVSITERKN